METLNMCRRVFFFSCLYIAITAAALALITRDDRSNRDIDSEFRRFFKFENEIVLSEKKNLIGSIRKLSLAPDGKLWILDSKSTKICSYTQTGEFITSVGRKGEGPGEFIKPVDFFIGKENVYVVDPLARKLHLFSLNWDFKYFFYIEDGRMVHEGKNGEIFIAAPRSVDDKNNGSCIHVYDKRGKLLNSFFPINENAIRQDLFCDGVCFDQDRDGDLFCAQEMEYKIYRYTAKGRLIKTFSKPSANYIPSPVKIFKNKFIRSEADKWVRSWTHIVDVKIWRDLVFITSLYIKGSYEYGYDIYNRSGELIRGNLAANYRLLYIDEKGKLYFLKEVSEPGGLDFSFHILIYSLINNGRPSR